MVLGVGVVGFEVIEKAGKKAGKKAGGKQANADKAKKWAELSRRRGKRKNRLLQNYSDVVTQRPC